MTLTGITIASTVLAVAIGHAAAEGIAFARAAPASCASPIDVNPVDALWTASVLGVVVFELAAIAEALRSEPSAWRLIPAASGLLLCIVGIQLRTRTIEQLGSAFAVPPDASAPAHLATCGLFRFVRHPSELGLLLLSAGIFALAPAWSTTALFIAGLLPLLAARIAREERALAQRLTQQHAAYRGRTPLLWPSLWSWPELLQARACRKSAG